MQRQAVSFSVGESPSWLRHRILIPAYQGSNPCSPAKVSLPGLSMTRAPAGKLKTEPPRAALFFVVRPRSPDDRVLQVSFNAYTSGTPNGLRKPDGFYRQCQSGAS